MTNEVDYLILLPKGKCFSDSDETVFLFFFNIALIPPPTYKSHLCLFLKFLKVQESIMRKANIIDNSA